MLSRRVSDFRFPEQLTSLLLEVFFLPLACGTEGSTFSRFALAVVDACWFHVFFFVTLEQLFRPNFGGLSRVVVPLPHSVTDWT